MVAMVADRTILVKIHMEFYSISWEVLEQVFSPFGVIEYIEVFCQGEEFHSKIRFKSQESAIEALECINHRDVYDGCCQLELFHEASWMETPSPLNQEIAREPRQIGIQDRELKEMGLSGKATSAPIPVAPVWAPISPTVQESPGILDEEFDLLSEERGGSPIEGDDNPVIQESPRSVQLEVEAPLGSTAGNSGEELIDVGEYAAKLRNTEEITNPVDDLNGEIEEISDDNLAQSRPSKDDESKESSNSENEANIEKHPIRVTPNPCEVMECDGTLKGLGELVVLLIQLMEIRIANSRMDSFDCLRALSAHNVFFKMPRRGVKLVMCFEVNESCSNLACFGLRSVSGGTKLNHDLIKLPYDRGKSGNKALSACFVMVREYNNEVATVKKFVFDPGGIDPLLARSRGQLSAHPSCLLGLIKVHRILDGILIFDPGGEIIGSSTEVDLAG